MSSLADNKEADSADHTTSKRLIKISSVDKLQPSSGNIGPKTTTRKQIVEARKRNNAY